MRLPAWRAGGVAMAAVLLVALTLRVGAQQIPGASTDAAAALARGEWPTYAGTYASAKYSPLDQINAANVATLKIAWRWMSPDHAVRAANPRIDPSMIHQGTPIMVNGVLYTSTSLSQVAAIDAATGQTKWVFDPGSHKLGMPTNLGWIHRGVAYWRDGADERIVMLTGHAFMIALDAKTGRPLEGFGTKGRVDLTEGLGRPVPSRWLYGHTSPPVIVRDVVVVGSSVLGFPSASPCPSATCAASTSAPASASGPSGPCPGPARSATRRGRTTRGRPSATPTCGR